MINLKLGSRPSPCNHGQNIWRFFHVLSQFLFAASEVELDSYSQNLYVQLVAQFAEQLKT